MARAIGITGNIASGKSSVGRLLQELGAARYIDADALVHRLYEPGQAVVQAISERFGSQVLTPEGGIDRRILGSIVFADPEALRALEKLVHPAVGELLKQELHQVGEDGFIVIDAVKLLEGVSGKYVDTRWLIICDPEIQKQRLMARNQLSEAEADLRLAAQPPLEPKKKLVDEIIDNSGTLEETRAQVEQALQRFLTKSSR